MSNLGHPRYTILPNHFFLIRIISLHVAPSKRTNSNLALSSPSSKIITSTWSQNLFNFLPDLHRFSPALCPFQMVSLRVPLNL